MRISHLAVARPILISGQTKTFLRSDCFEMTLDGFLIKIRDPKSEDVTYVTLMSTEWFKPIVASVEKKAEAKKNMVI